VARASAIPASVVEAMVRMHSSGHTLVQIAIQFGYVHSTVRTELQRRGIDTSRRVPALTPRQIQVMQFRADGHTREHTAHVLGISVHTVDSVLKAVRVRLEARDTAHAIALAFRHGHVV